MTHQQKVALLIAEAREKGISQYVVAPPIFRFLWAIGIKIPPPPFIAFWLVALLMGLGWSIPFSILIYLWMYLRHGLPERVGVTDFFTACFVAGCFFGLIMAAVYRYQGKKLRLTTWRDYGISN